MKNAKRTFSLFMTVLIVLFSITPTALAAQSYPDGIAKQQVLSSISKVDTALDNLLESTYNKSLKEVVLPEIYSDKTLSALTVGLYSMIEENAESISSAGIKVTVSDVAEGLGEYPKVQKKLLSCSKWSEVNLDGVSWNVEGKKDFTEAVGCIFAPFNELLYTLLCDGTYSLNRIIGIDGDLGYENAIVPVFKALGWEKYTASAEFYEDAKNNKNSMVTNIVSDLMAFLEYMLEAPCDRLTDVLPSIAYFLNNGGFDEAVAKLIEPLRLQLFNIKTFIKIETILSFIQNSEEYTQSMTLNLNDILTGTDLKVAEINLEELASCGTVSGDTVVSDKADTFLVLLRWIIDTAKLNKDSIAGMLGSEMPSEMTDAINSLMSESSDELIKGVISLLNQTEAKVLEFSWTYDEYTPVEVNYTPNLGAEKYQRVVDGIDDLINEFILEGGQYKNTRQALEPQIYSNTVVTELAKGIYSIFEGEEMKMLCDVLNLNVTTSGVADVLEGSSYSDARHTLHNTESWSDVKSIDWGFKDGSKKGFVNAVCDVLVPFEPMLNMLLVGDKITVLDAVDIYGSNGYNTAVIPILEALGCNSQSIETYDEFKASVSKGEGVKSIVTAVVSLIERILDKPVYTVTEILPNILWFMQSGGLQTAIENLMYPFTAILSEFGMENVLNLSQLMGETDTDKMMSEMLAGADMGIDLQKLDIEQFASMGQLVSVQSKRTLNGQPTTFSYVKADQPAIAVTLLRFIAEIMKTPGNEDMMLGLMGNEEDSMLSGFSGGMGKELEKMTVDETVEWLYKLFFRERAVVEEKVTEKYLPTITYEPVEENGNGAVVVILLAAAAVTVIAVSIRRRKRKSTDEEISEDNETEIESEYQEV